MDLTEDQLIAAIRSVVSGEATGVRVGVGDDAAVLDHGPGELVLTTDMLVEGVHFELRSISARDLGAKSIVVNVSDIAAMGASPRYALASIGLPARTESSWVMELYGGMRAACDEYALSLVGGDTIRSEELIVSVTVAGEVAAGRAVTRAGAEPGDLVVVTGALGGAAGGLAVSRLPAAKARAVLSTPWARELLRALERPVARVGEGQTLAQTGATAMMDLSDGLAKDLSRLCAESGVGARVDLARVPVAPALLEGGADLGVDAFHLALGGGEDYELLATIDVTDLERARHELDERFGVTLTEVGVIIEEGFVAVDAEGVERPLAPEGWDHFADAG